MRVIKDRSLMTAMVIISTAICLRAPITSVGSVLHLIASDLNLNGTIAGTITTIPLVVMAVLSPFISKIGTKLGTRLVLMLGLFILLMGILIRSFAGFWGLLIGTAMIGAGITFGNVLIPALIKLCFPHKIGSMTGIFTTTMSICSGIGAGISVPIAIEMGVGWRLTFCIWAGTTAIALIIGVVWIINTPGYLGSSDDLAQSDKLRNKKPLYKIPMVWSIVILFGGQSSVFFMMATWLPTIIIDKGISAVTAGGIATVFQIAAIPANLATPIIAGKIKDQRILALCVTGIGIVGLIGLTIGSNIVVLTISTAILSLSLGGTFSLSLVLFGMKTTTGGEAARLSGFSQSAGYVMAAIGPAFAGYLYDISNNWNLPIGLAMGILFMASFAGFIAGKDKKIYEK